MNLEVLLKRKQDIEAALVQTINQHNILVGHKQEIEFQIAELQKPEVSDDAVPEEDKPVE